MFPFFRGLCDCMSGNVFATFFPIDLCNTLYELVLESVHISENWKLQYYYMRTIFMLLVKIDCFFYILHVFVSHKEMIRGRFCHAKDKMKNIGEKSL